MTADRLREAASVSTAYGIWADGPGRRGKTRVSPQVAALLRAVADESEVCWCGPEYTERGLSRPGCPAHDVMIASRDAALALADTILGAES